MNKIKILQQQQQLMIEIENEEIIQPLLIDLSKTTTDNKSIIVNETAAVGAVTLSVWYKLFSSTPIRLVWFLFTYSYYAYW